MKNKPIGYIVMALHGPMKLVPSKFVRGGILMYGGAEATIFKDRRRADRAIVRTRRFAVETGSLDIDILKAPEKVFPLALRPPCSL